MRGRRKEKKIRADRTQERRRGKRSTRNFISSAVVQFKVVQKIRARLLIVVHTTSGEPTRVFDGTQFNCYAGAADDFRRLYCGNDEQNSRKESRENPVAAIVDDDDDDDLDKDDDSARRGFDGSQDWGHGLLRE